MPDWTPAAGTISLIWQILYPIIIVSFGYVFLQTGRGKLPNATAVPCSINLIANLCFTPILFGMKNLPLATLDILIVWSTILWMMIVIWPRALGRCGPGAVSRLGFNRDHIADQYFLDEPGSVTKLRKFCNFSISTIPSIILRTGSVSECLQKHYEHYITQQ